MEGRGNVIDTKLLDAASGRSAMRKAMWRILPLILVAYLMACRGLIGSAVLAGAQALLILFVRAQVASERRARLVVAAAPGMDAP